MFTVRNLGGIALFLFGTTFLWLTPAFASKDVSTDGALWAVTRVMALVTLAGFLVATYGLFQRDSWWETVAVGSAVLGLLTLVPFWIAAAKSGDAVATWEAAWERFPRSWPSHPELRRVIYTTNAIESLNYQLRKVTKNRGHFPNDDAAIKLLWLAICNIEDKPARQSGKERGLPGNERKAPGRLVESQVVTSWKAALAQLALVYPDRINPSSEHPPRDVTQQPKAGPLHRKIDKLWRAAVMSCTPS
jgi:hypothetical protein